MTESSAHHQPAMKVAGRRLSITNRHKSHAAGERVGPETEDKMAADAFQDYPRPAPPAEQAPHSPIHNHYDEEIPSKKDKKHEAERKVHEFAQRKNETTRPTRESVATQKGQTIRISQPAGKGLHV